MRLALPLLLLIGSLLYVRTATAEQKVAIRADIPGGNVLVVKNEGAEVQLAPDLRGGQPWFFWHFEAAAAEPGKVTFAFAGSPIIGVRGPAVSLDEGKMWQFLGAEHCTYAAVGTPAKERRETFTYEFKPERMKARFAVAIPYLPSNFKEFAAARAGNPHLKQEILTKSRSGTPVEMLVVGAPGADRKSMLVTARHHACESMASYVLEGFLDEAMSESPAGIAFREQYALFAVPMVDRDGVAAGDQGKNRDPHDHNRDYGPMPIYPEVAAIQELGEAQDIRYAIDFHCPALRGDIHEAMHFLGLGTPRMKENLDRLIVWVKEERPQRVMTPLNYLTDAAKPNAVNPKINSHHFATRKGSVLAATLEVPYTQASPKLDIDMAREYGRGLLRAWTRATFAIDDEQLATGDERHKQLMVLRSNFLKLYRSKPDEAEKSARDHMSALGEESNLLLAQLRLFQKQYDEAIGFCDAALKGGRPTMSQRVAAAVLRLQIMSSDARTSPEEIEACLNEFTALPYPADEQAAKAYEAAAKFYQSKKQYERAAELKRRQIGPAAPFEQGKVLLELAVLHDEAGHPGEAIATRELAVKLLRERLGPKPARSIFGAMMTLDLFDAVCGIPTSTLEEKRAAATLALEHEVVAPMYKERVRKKLAELEQAAPR